MLLSCVCLNFSQSNLQIVVFVMVSWNNFLGITYKKPCCFGRNNPQVILLLQENPVFALVISLCIIPEVYSIAFCKYLMTIRKRRVIYMPLFGYDSTPLWKAEF